jgi:hypothetical protein
MSCLRHFNLRHFKFFAAALLWALVLHPGLSPACSVCYGEPDSGMAKGLVWGVVSLLGVVVMVLGGIATFFVYVARKSPTESSTESPTDKIQ